MVTAPAISADRIRLRQKRSHLGQESSPLGATLTLSDKLNELFEHGYSRDDIFGVAIPLLMQGKIRIEIGDLSERLEMEDKSMICQRSTAVQVFEDYLAARWS
jgi:hypothetical protein